MLIGLFMLLLLPIIALLAGSVVLP